MPELLLELFSEEIPARMQAAAAKDLERLVVGSLSDRGLLFESIKAFSGPRRLTLVIGGLPAQQKDVDEERKGPRVGAPEKAIEGFLRSAGVTLEQCVKENDGKGEFYVARIKRVGRATADVLSEFLPETLAKLPWPKSMRWPGSNVRWVRPLHAVVCTLDGETVPFAFAGVVPARRVRARCAVCRRWLRRLCRPRGLVAQLRLLCGFFSTGPWARSELRSRSAAARAGP